MDELVYYAAITKEWGISFDELISRHTEGQLRVLVAGLTKLSSEIYGSESKVQATANQQAEGKHVARVPMKEMKKWTKEQYEHYLRTNGMF